ncbi:NUDIX domain-containing protein [Shouchella miscanthi]|uniref:NUDIX domain-containing protein n=2 Tax=Shouchella TaxID=2893057 RepID=UPI000553BEB7|nr:NUDIX domain-containing protein [Shouchella miscanthi]
MTSLDVYWGNGLVQLTWVPMTTLPFAEKITSAHGFCFYQNQVMLVYLKKRGWDLPGGHVEKGETPKAAFQRECFEEGYVSGDCTLLGCIKVNHEKNSAWNETSPYPKIGYQAFYRMNVSTLHPFSGHFEATKRTFVDPNQYGGWHHGWHRVYASALTEALRF